MDHRNWAPGLPPGLYVGDSLPLSLDGQLKDGRGVTWPLPAAKWSCSAPRVCALSAEEGDSIMVRALAPGNCVITVTHAKNRVDRVTKEETVWRAEGAVHHMRPWEKSPDWEEIRSWQADEQSTVLESWSWAITVKAREDVFVPDILIPSTGERKAGQS